MKILIVNAYSQASRSPQFQSFEKTIKQIFLQLKQLIDISCDVFTCDSSNIDEYLFEPSLPKKDAARAFNFLDMVFIEGDANLRPWSPRAKKFLLLVKMCLKSNKILWASSFGFQAIVYLVSTNIEKRINVVNGLNGGNIKDIKKSVLNLDELKNTDLFLDNITGDFYKYDQTQKEWIPYANAGLHCRKKAQETPQPGKIIMKPELFRVDSKPKELLHIYEGQNNETICYLFNKCINHYSMIDVEHEFLVPSKNQWDLHLINFPNPKLTFSVMADSKYTSQIIEVNQNIFSTQFNVSRKYPETVKILKNFMKHQMMRFQNGTQSEPIEHSAYKLLDGSIGGDQPANLLKPTEIIPEPSINCFHSKTIKQKAPNTEIVQDYQQQMYQQYQDNIVQDQNEMRQTQKSRIQSANKRFGSNISNLHTNFQMPQNSDINNIDQIGQRGGRHRPITAMTRPMTAQTVKSFSDFKGSGKPVQNRLFSGKSAYSMQSNINQMTNNFVDSTDIENRQLQQSMSQSNLNRTDATAFGRNFKKPPKEPLIKNNFDNNVGEQRILKTKSEIRQLLHPQISQQGLPQKDTIWIPGYKSCKNLGFSSVWKQKGDFNQSKVLRVNSGKKKLFQSKRQKELDEQEKLYKTLQSCKIKTKNTLRFVPDYDEAREVPVIRCTSEYLSQYDKDRIEEKEQMKKELGNHHMRFGKVEPPKYIPSVISQGDTKFSAVRHSFREDHKEDWIDYQNFQSAV